MTAHSAMAKIVVVFHSGYGHTQRLAQAVAQGAGATLIAIDAEGNVPASTWESLAAADAIIFGSPTYMGGVSWQFKKFADASSKQWYAQAWKDKLFGGFTASANMNGEKQSTLHYLMTLAMQHGGVWVGTGLHHNTLKTSQRTDVNYLASSTGPMAQTPGDASADAMNAGDLETGRLFGERIAVLARKFRA
jgi:NAD(P)H dehydrogenase (quinone)